MTYLDDGASKQLSQMLPFPKFVGNRQRMTNHDKSHYMSNKYGSSSSLFIFHQDLDELGLLLRSISTQLHTFLTPSFHILQQFCSTVDKSPVRKSASFWTNIIRYSQKWLNKFLKNGRNSPSLSNITCLI